MRSLLWDFLLILVALTSIVSAEATIPNSREITKAIEGDTTVILFMIGEDDVGNTAKRYLRSDAKTGQLKDEEEERIAVPSFITNLKMNINKWIKTIKVNWTAVKRSWAAWKEKMLLKTFEWMDKLGDTPSSLGKRLSIYGMGASESRYQKLVKEILHLV
ncbi:RxLR effector protein [Phytophthora megakarya]|uniref:RxLR effector protein n=1 Tax=Phytophthora megakarya TaxID=4795 RepID=A0A225WXZ9_9STRA|nr:RxLR effector protein [Phytophthora megakarya]